MSPSWKFPSSDNGPTNGITTSDVETFKGEPMMSLAREICQNSLDAQADENRPVHVEFKAFDISPDRIPGISDLEDAFSRALEYWSGNKSAKKFFQSGLSVLRGPKVRCLRISDFNTTGLAGSVEACSSSWCSSPWNSLIKASGVSDKSGGSGGSFGIGKFAPIVCSALRTVFYSTVDEKETEAYQGVSRIASFKDRNGIFTQGTGYYGNEKNTPIFEQFRLDPDYSRSRGCHGTDIYILGFMGGEDWERQMTASILEGFFYAVYKGALTADVNGTNIDRESISGLMKTCRDSLQEHAYDFYQVLTDEENSHTFKINTSEMSPDFPEGTLTLKLMIMPNLCRRVAIVRQTGMKIYNQGYISSFISFAGVMYIEGIPLNQALRETENPQHTKWEPQRSDNPNKANALIRAIKDFIRKKFKELNKDSSREGLSPSVGAYLSLPREKSLENLNKSEAISDSIQSVQKHVTVLADKSSENSGSGSGKDPGTAGGSGTGSGSGGSRAGNGPGTGGGTGGTGNNSGSDAGRPSPISPMNVHAAVKNRAGGEYVIIFTPRSSAQNGYIDVFLSAESGDYEAEILSASCSGFPELQARGNRISGFSFDAGKSLKINVKLNSRDYCALEVKAYGNKG